jgi:acyloxyacyl hydrolase
LTPADIIEPSDGFHPNQVANYFLADILFENLQRDKPEWLGPINPNNAIID